MNVILIENNTNFDVCKRFYRRAILNTLIEINPIYCLEIGSHLLQSSRVFSYYFDQYQYNGHLITVDISEWDVKLDLPNVSRLMVYPHQVDIQSRHGGLQVYNKNYERVLTGKSNAANINIRLIHDEMDRLNVDQFDFCFCDGDHSKISFLADLLICKWLVRPEGWILIDDIFDKGHEQAETYAELKRKGNVFYEFDDWSQWQSTPVGMGLIQNKELRI